MLVLLGCGIYMTLSSNLSRNLDQNIRERAEQICKFRDVLSMIMEGTFEDHAGEYITFYYLKEGQLAHIAPKGNSFPVSDKAINRVLSGESFYENVEIPEKGRFRVFLTRFDPDSTVTNPTLTTDNNQNTNSDGDNKSHLQVETKDKIQTSYQDLKEKDQSFKIAATSLVIARPVESIEKVLIHLFNILAVAIPVSLTLTIGGGILLAHQALSPVKKIADTARQIGEKDLTRRIDVRTKDELGYLANTLNQMIERLQKSFERQKEFTSDASHELRSPLAVIQAEASLSLRKKREPEEYRKTIELILAEAERMGSLTNQLLELARMDASRNSFNYEPVELKELILELSKDIETLCKDKGIKLQTHQLDHISVSGDSKSLRRVFMNILYNSIKYTNREGAISIALIQKGEFAETTISDTGIGIPSDDLPHIFERFYRVDKARSRSEGGSGLGLSICKHIVDTHRGQVAVSSQSGIGTTVSVKLPISMS